MKGKGKSKRGKAIIGIALAAIMLASVFAAMAPMGTAQVDPSDGRQVSTAELVIIGETNVSFFNTTAGPGRIIAVTVKGPTEDIGDTPKNSTLLTSTTGYIDTTEETMVAGEYYIIDRTTNAVYKLTFTNPKFTLEIKKARMDDKVSSCVKGDSIDFDLTTNLEAIDAPIPSGITYKVTDAADVPRDVKVTLDANGNNLNTFTGTDKVGEYTVYVKTNKSACNGLEVSSSPITFTVTELGISISADKDRIAKGKEVALTGSTSPKEAIWVNLTSGTKTEVTFVGYKGEYTGADWTPTVVTPGVSVTTKADGTYTVVAKIDDIGTYEFEAKIGTSTKKVTVEVVELAAEVTTDKTTYAVGEDIEISGTSTAGNYAIIAFDGTVVRNETIKADDTFSYILTGTDAYAKKPPGSYKIEVFIYPTTVTGGDRGDKTSKIKSATTGLIATADASTVILYSEPDLTVEISTEYAALGDEFKVTGTATGAKEVTILVVAPKGTGGTGIGVGSQAAAGYAGLSKKAPSVSTIDYTFSQKYDIEKSGIDTGKYLIVVVSPGRDGGYGRWDLGTLLDAVSASADYTSKTQSEFMGIVEDACRPDLTDDILWMGYISLKTAFVMLDPIESVAVGKPLTVTGTTNRKDGYLIMVTVEGPTTLVPVNVKVENGVFNATFDTTDAAVGTYTVKADDGDGHTDDAKVEILTAVPVTPTPEVEVTPTPEVEVTPTPEVEEPTPTPRVEEEPTPTPTPEPPGFEAVFAIAGLLAVAYLVLRKRR